VTWRSTLGIASTILVLCGCYFVGVENRELLAQQLLFWTAADGSPVGLAVGQALLGSLAIGAAGVALAWAVRSGRQRRARNEERRGERRRRALEEAHRAGLEAAIRGRLPRALACQEQVLELEPEHLGALAAAADALRMLGRPAEALELRERLLALRPGDADVLLALAEDHRARGDLGLAAGALERALAARPEEPEVVARGLLETRLEAGDTARALEAHARWAKLARDRPPEEVALERAALETRQAVREAQEGRWREAQAVLRRVLKRQPDFVPAALALAHAQVLEGNEAGAVTTWVEGYERTREGAFLVAAEEHFLGSPSDDDDSIERASAALAAMRRFAACSGERPQAIAFLGKLQTRLEMLEEAAETLDSVRESFPENPTFTYYAARIAEKRGKGGVAAAWYRGILKAMDVLRPVYRCGACEAVGETHADRCRSCGRWGRVSLDIGMKRLAQPLPAAHPVYAVRGEEEELPREEPAEESGRG
jgi:tetratricopeptide (TPR) repeat protein